MSLYKSQTAPPTDDAARSAETVRKIVTSLTDSIAASCTRLHREVKLNFPNTAALEASLGKEDAAALNKFCERLRCALKLVHPPLAARILADRKKDRETAKAHAKAAKAAAA